MGSQLHIRLLGEFRVSIDDQVVAGLDSARVRSLLAYLVMHQGQVLERARIAYLFWPESSEKQARTNLRHQLHTLRHAIPDTEIYLDIGTKELMWKSEAPFELDISEFDRHLKEATAADQKGDADQAMTKWGLAVASYRGPLLPTVYEDWVEPERGRLARDFAGALERLIKQLEDRRRYDEAMELAHKLRSHEPTRESTYVTLIRLSLLKGDRSAALEVYQECVTALGRELGVEPGTTLKAIYQRLVDGEELEIEKGPLGAGLKDLSLEGRHPEWLSLKEGWSQAKLGHAGMVVLTGEPGIGKSRLAEELVSWAESQGAKAARARSYEAEGRLAFAPAAEWLRTPSVRASAQDIGSVWIQELARIVPEFNDETQDPNQVVGDLQRHKLFEALSRGVTAGGEPTLLLADDMQWMDSETLEWLHYLIRFAPTAPLLVLGTIREAEIRAGSSIERLLLDLRKEDRISEISLDGMSREEGGRLAAQILGRDLEEEELDGLLQETGGNPLFIVESARSGLAEGDESFRNKQAALPPKVHALIATRLQSISESAKDLAALASVIGRGFDLDLLTAASGQREEQLAESLEELWERRIVCETERPGHYDYAHDKLREVAYSLISPVRRPILHRQVASALEDRYSGNLDQVSSQLAFHYEQGGKPEEAVRYCQCAAESARAVFAYEEAARLLKKAISLLPGIGMATDELELKLQRALAACLVSAHGYSAPGTVEIYERAIELTSRLTKVKDPRLVRGLATSCLQNGHFERAKKHGAELLELREDPEESLLLVEAGYVLGVANFWIADFEKSRFHLQTVLDSFLPENLDAHLSDYVQDPYVIALSRMAWTQIYLGQPRLALDGISRTVDYLEENSHPMSEAYARYFCAHTSVDLGDWKQAGYYLTQMEELFERHPHTYWVHRAMILRGRLALEEGDPERALVLMEEGVATYQDLKNRLGGSEYWQWFAEAFLACGQIDRAKESLASGFAYVEKSDERYFEAELHRVGGRIAMAEGDEEKSEECLTRALEMAERQGIPFLQLRAAIDLSELNRFGNRPGEARGMLASCIETCEGRVGEADLLKAKKIIER